MYKVACIACCRRGRRKGCCSMVTVSLSTTTLPYPYTTRRFMFLSSSWTRTTTTNSGLPWVLISTTISMSFFCDRSTRRTPYQAGPLEVSSVMVMISSLMLVSTAKKEFLGNQPCEAVIRRKWHSWRRRDRMALFLENITNDLIQLKPVMKCVEQLSWIVAEICRPYGCVILNQKW